ncbi:hypothetical protein LTR37_018138 [Vermiconidia calcicola]|uniref:Uncharacterized protein n=1 Tax=Vermiconidia calcicola TaxID=1690605 RepID=A0ACC3MIW0_9PEZI|nr:hypothetical protein LTR37_018138 [Vermiconidia calcicola]
MNASPFKEGCVIANRGGIVENSHYVHIAVVDSSGKLLRSVGNPNRVTLLRSAAKPAQAIAILETGAFEKYGFNDEDLALMCASHNAEDIHLEQARSMLNKIEAKDDQLNCGGHPSISPELNEQWIRDRVKLTPIYNNCSGKHTGMLAGAKALGSSTNDYHLLENQMQQRVTAVVEQLCGASKEDVLWGIDGCNLPAPAMPLHNMARIFSKIARAADEIDASTRASEIQRMQNMARVYNAMCHNPYLLGGDDRFCSELPRIYNGDIIGKVGADGCYGIAIRSAQTRKLGTDGAVGVAIKVEDGNLQILYAAVVEALKQLEIGTKDEWDQLRRFHHPPRLNTMGFAIGKIEHAFQVYGAS